MKPSTSLNQIICDPIKRRNLESRFWPKVAVTDEDKCWEWTARAKHSFGYGRMTAGRGVNLKAHQISWALKNGRIPDGKLIRHSCDNPSCCNPSHLKVGTQVDNMQDCKRRGRLSPPPVHIGDSHPNAKLDSDNFDSILNDPRSVGLIAQDYGVSEKTIYLLRRGKARL